MNDSIYQTRPLIGISSSESQMSRRSRASSYLTKPIRLIDRDAAFKQSKGNIKIKRDNVKRSLYWADPIHSLLHWDTWKLILVMFILYLVIIFSFGAIYYNVSTECGLSMKSWLDASYFSIVTFATIGYGTPDIYFNECMDGFATITVQSYVGVLFDAIVIGLIFTRIVRGSTRASTIVFSDKAVIREIRGKFYFSFQVVEMRMHQLVEAHVRCYAINHSYNMNKFKKYSNDSSNSSLDDEDNNLMNHNNNQDNNMDNHDQTSPNLFFKQTYMRLTQPDDDLGGHLFLSLPSNVIHHIDTSSPLCPRNLRSARTRYPRVVKRYDDFEDGDNVFVNDHKKAYPNLREGINDHLNSADLEIIVLVEGIDALTSYTIQARHSYTVDDVEWDATFASCVYPDEDNIPHIDFDRFHKVINSPPIQ